MRKRAVFLSIALLALSASAFAGPTAEEKAGARAAATEGNKAFADKKYAEALDLFTRAEKLMHAPTHVLMIARSQAALGQLVRARESYNALTREELVPGAPPAFKLAQTDGKRELDALEPRVPTLDVKVDLKSDASGIDAAAAKNVVISMDGARIPAALVGVAHPVDPGEHKLTAIGDKVAADEKIIQVAEGAHLTVVLPLHAAPDAVGGTPPAEPAKPDTGVTRAGPPPAPSGGGMKIAGFVGIGLGVVGLGVGGVFLALGGAKRSEANDAYAKCGSSACVTGSPEQQSVDELDASANTKQTIGAVGLVAGGVLAVTGVTLVVLSSKKPATQGRVTPWIGPTSAGVRGAF